MNNWLDGRAHVPLRTKEVFLRLRPATLSAIGFGLLVVVQAATAAPQNGECDLPSDLQRQIATKYPGRKIVTLSDLDPDDQNFFQRDHSNSCPGLVKVDFYGDGKPTFALVLISKQNSELVIAHQAGETWKTAVLGTGGASAPVVWSLPPGEYTSVDGDKKIRATKPVIVFTKYEDWGILYAWTGKGVRKIWITD